MASRKTWNRAKEYEDDFLFVLFLMKHFFLKAADDECRAVLAAHEAAAEGEDQSHRDVGVAFIEKDGPRFDAALRVLLDERSKRVEGWWSGRRCRRRAGPGSDTSRRRGWPC